MTGLRIIVALAVSTVFLADARADRPRAEPSSSSNSSERRTVDAAAAAVGPRSLSCGRTNRGRLSDPAVMPYRGKGFVIPQPWRSRGLRYGTDELVGLLKRAAAKVTQVCPGAVLGIADLAKRYGGPAEHHRSHQSGRDADLLYYAMGMRGKPFYPDKHMPVFRKNKRAHDCSSPEKRKRIALRFFDVRANWAFIKAVLTDDQVIVERVFMATRIRDWLLAYAKKTGESRRLIRRARKTLMRPRDSRAHADHMHLRIGCSKRDAVRGKCVDLEMRRGKRKRHGRWNGICR